MEVVHFRFYAQLNDFLPQGKKHRSFVSQFNAPQSVKHLIESVGVPHSEVFLILVDGEPVDFKYLARSGERIAVYPLFHSVEWSPPKLLQPMLPSPAGFVLDNHLGKLARYLRLLGFDTLYPKEHLKDEQLAQMAGDQDRIMLTRDRRLLMRRVVDHGYYLRSDNAKQQAVEVLSQFELYDHIQPWRRCLQCNGLLHEVKKEEVIDQLEPKTRQYYDRFRQCQSCGQIYWKGSHYKKLDRLIEEISLNRSGASGC